MNDVIINTLRQMHPYIDFVTATDEVIAGTNLENSKRLSGKNISIAERQSPEIDLDTCHTGRVMSVGIIEQYPHCELRVFRLDKALHVGLYNNNKLISRELRCETDAHSADEACFIWMGPVEDICTPWSDNSLPQCQVVTIEGLRSFAKQFKT